MCVVSTGRNTARHELILLLKLEMSSLPRMSALERANRKCKMMVLKQMTGIKFRLGLRNERGANTFDFCLIACI